MSAQLQVLSRYKITVLLFMRISPIFMAYAQHFRGQLLTSTVHSLSLLGQYANCESARMRIDGARVCLLCTHLGMLNFMPCVTTSAIALWVSVSSVNTEPAVVPAWVSLGEWHPWGGVCPSCNQELTYHCPARTATHLLPGNQTISVSHYRPDVLFLDQRCVAAVAASATHQ